MGMSEDEWQALCAKFGPDITARQADVPANFHNPPAETLGDKFRAWLAEHPDATEAEATAHAISHDPCAVFTVRRGKCSIEFTDGSRWDEE